MIKLIKRQLKKYGSAVKLTALAAVVSLGLVIHSADPRAISDVRANSVNVIGLYGQGSGVIIHSDYGDTYILTAAHVVDDVPLREPVLKISQGTNEWVASVMVCDTKYDLALLKLTNHQLVGRDTALLHPGHWVPVGTHLLHVGNTYGYHDSYVEGFLSAVGRTFDGGVGVYDQTSTLAWPGSSGGGVFTDDGKLVGLITLGVGPGLNWMVPTREIYNWAIDNNLHWLLL